MGVDGETVESIETDQVNETLPEGDTKADNSPTSHLADADSVRLVVQLKSGNEIVTLPIPRIAASKLIRSWFDMREVMWGPYDNPRYEAATPEEILRAVHHQKSAQWFHDHATTALNVPVGPSAADANGPTAACAAWAVSEVIGMFTVEVSSTPKAG